MPPSGDPARRPRRLGLILPFVALALGIALWSAYWVFASHKLSQKMDETARRLAAKDIAISWQQRRLYGYPFRFEMDLVGVKLSEPSGWALHLPALKAKAAAYSPQRWVFLAPDGATLNRPRGGAVSLSSPLLRASLSVMPHKLPHLIIEGRDMTLSTPPGTRPFWLKSVQRLDFALQPGPDDQEALLLRIDNGKASLGGIVARIVEDQALDLDWQSSISHASSLTGRSWPEAVQAWTAAGGQISLRQSQLSFSKARLTLSGGPLTVAADGHLEGDLAADLGEIVSAVARAGTGASIPGSSVSPDAPPKALNASLSLKDGKIHLGPLPIAASPRIF